MSGSQLREGVFDSPITRCMDSRSLASGFRSDPPKGLINEMKVERVFLARDHRDTLKHGGGHADQREASFLSAERPHKPNERRNVSFIRQRSSGVAARLRA